MSVTYKFQDLCGKGGFASLQNSSPEPSPAFERALDTLWARHKSSGRIGDGFLKADGLEYITNTLIPAANLNNPMEAYFICNSVKHLSSPRNYSDETDYPVYNPYLRGMGLPCKVFHDLAKKHEGTTLGHFCSLITTVQPDQYHNTVFNFTF